MADKQSNLKKSKSDEILEVISNALDSGKRLLGKDEYVELLYSVKEIIDETVNAYEMFEPEECECDLDEEWYEEHHSYPVGDSGAFEGDDF